MRLTALEQQMSSVLGIPLKICRTDTAPPAWALSVGERQKLANLLVLLAAFRNPLTHERAGTSDETERIRRSINSR